MTPSVPLGAEVAARRVARSQYDLSDHEINSLVSDTRFATVAHLLEQYNAHLGTLRPDLSGARTEEGDLDVRRLDDREVEAYRAAGEVLRWLYTTQHKVAEATLGRDIERETLNEIIESNGGENT